MMYGTENLPTTEVPVQKGDTVVLDGETYDIEAVTPTGLVRFEDRQPLGEATFGKRLMGAETVEIRRRTVSVKRVSEGEYHEAVSRFAEGCPAKAAFLTRPVEADRYYLTESCGAGFALDRTTLLGLFNHTAKPGTGSRLVGEAIKRDADELMCFDTSLTDLYVSWGFEVDERVPWDEDLAPDEWDYDRYGTPDVVWMSR